MGSRDARGARGGAGREPGPGPIGCLVQDPQGARLRQVRQQEPRHAAPHELARVLGGPQGVHGAVRRRVPGRGRAGSVGPEGAAGPGPAQLRRGDRRPPGQHASSSTRSATGWSRWRGSCPDQVEGFNLGGRGTEIFSRQAPDRRPRLSRRRCGRRRARRLPTGRRWRPGAPGSTPTPRRVRAAALHRLLGGPGRVDQHRGLRQGLRRACRAGAGTSATRTRAARCCRSRSPSSRTPA